MDKHRDVTLRRIKGFQKDLEATIYSQTVPVELSVYSPEDNKDHNRMTFAEAMKGEYKPIQVGEQVGPGWSTHWFKVDVTIPEGWSELPLDLLWNSHSEACLFSTSGEILQGLSYDHKTEYRLSDEEKAAGKFTIYVEVACNTLFGVGDPGEYLDTDSPTPAGTLKQAELAVFNPKAWELYWDYIVISEMSHELAANHPRGAQALGVANKVANVCFPGDYSTYDDALALTNEYLSKKAGEGAFKLAAVGNAHTDTAWLWPVAETKRKIYRTMSAVLRYMDDYPEYKFAWSQALYWEWAEQEHPEHFQKMIEKVKAGQLLPTGGAWVEPDCNLPNGESLVRQFLYGQLYYKNKIDFDCEIFWQPDVFGYAAQLPQIMQEVELKYFLTQKMSWNQFNKLPHHSMWWEGLDGSKVLTHFPPADCYEGPTTVKSLTYTQNNYKDHDRTDEAIYLYGHGDGGGGPTKGMLETIRRTNDLDGMPKLTQSTPIDFFHRLEEKGDDLCKWVGELYLELHRGTYTAQAKQKLYNRLSEILMRDTELLSVVTGNELDKEELDRVWKLILINQFHDIIPGSSIQEAHEVSREEYADILASGQKMLDEVLAAFTGEAGDKLQAVNTLGHDRTEVVELPEGIAGSQTAANGKQLGVVSAPSVGFSVAPAAASDNSVSVREENGSFIFENSSITATINSAGRLSSLFDKNEEREVLAEGSVGNNLAMFDDKPLYWDAWDIDIYHMEKRWDVSPATSIKILEEGPLRASIEVKYEISEVSTMTQVISLDALTSQVEFDCDVEWYEDNKLLKVEFPWAIQSEKATYEIQYGNVERPTHFNTSWDMAKFEVCAQRWADLAEYGYGVALINDCKYGYSTKDNVMALSLLRSPKRPDKTCDMGEHKFRYAVMPHSGTFQEAGVIQAAERFNVPMKLNTTAKEEVEQSWFSVNKDNVIIDCVKKAEESDAIIVRLYEAHGRRGKFELNSTLPVKSISRCNAIERQDQPLDWNDGLSMLAEPFKIITLKIELEK